MDGTKQCPMCHTNILPLLWLSIHYRDTTVYFCSTGCMKLWRAYLQVGRLISTNNELQRIPSYVNLPH